VGHTGLGAMGLGVMGTVMGASVQDRKPSYEFHFQGLLKISARQLKGWFKSKTSIQEYRNDIQNLY
jgi:hypothetical protein